MTDLSGKQIVNIIHRNRSKTAKGAPPPISIALALLYTLFTLILVARYLSFYGWWNLLWLCDFANLILCAGLLIGSRRLISWAAVGVFIPQLLWPLDLLSRLVFGRHLIGGTEYMFNPAIPLDVRLLSLYHILMLMLIVLALSHSRYDPRALSLQILSGSTLLILTFLFTPPERDINWVFGLFGRPQHAVSPLLYFILCLFFYPIVVYLPNHYLLRFLFPPDRNPPPTS